MGAGLAGCWGDDDEIDSIEKVVTALVTIRDAAAAEPPAVDGIAAFAELYTIITRNVLETSKGTAGRRFADPHFLIELDVRFARRYLAAMRTWESGHRDAPACWKSLFDARGAGRPSANFAACGVNAHVNFDLAFALLETWETYPPTDERREDYDLVNEIFSDEMDRLRETFPTTLSEDDGSWLDRLGNLVSSVVVRWTRGLAWEAAAEVWALRDPAERDGGLAYRQAYDRLERRLDGFTHALGVWLLDLDRIP